MVADSSRLSSGSDWEGGGTGRQADERAGSTGWRRRRRIGLLIATIPLLALGGIWLRGCFPMAAWRVDAFDRPTLVTIHGGELRLWCRADEAIWSLDESFALLSRRTPDEWWNFYRRMYPSLRSTLLTDGFGPFRYGSAVLYGSLTHVVIPIWPFCTPFVLAIALMMLKPMRWERRVRAGRCGECGYDLTGNVSGICPECGTPTEDRLTGRSPASDGARP